MQKRKNSQHFIAEGFILLRHSSINNLGLRRTQLSKMKKPSFAHN